MTYASQTSNLTAGSLSVASSRPGTVVAGTQLVAILAHVYSPPAGEVPLTGMTPPSGWAQPPGGYGSFTSAGGLTIEMWVYSHIEGSSEPSSYTWTWTGNNGTLGTGLSIYNMGTTPIQPGTVQIQGFEPNVPIVWAAAAQTATVQQVLTQVWTSHNGTTQYSGMTRAAAANTADMTPYVASVTPGAVPTRTAASDSSAGIGIQGLVGFFAAVPSAPSAPTLISPIGGAPIDATAAQPITAEYNSTDGADCNAYVLRVKLSGGSYVYWDATAGTLTSTTPVWNTLATTVPDGGQIQVTIPASVLSNGHTYNWSYNTQESAANLQGTFAADATFITQTAPTVTVTAPTGTITTTTTPAITWTESLHSGSSQISYRVVIESGSYGTTPGSGTLVYDSGTVLGSGLTATPDPLGNSTTYRAFVMITQTGPQDSTWSHSDFTIDVTPPNVPILTAAPDTDPTTGEPRVAITILGSDSGGLWSHSNTVFEVQVSADGVSYVDVRGASALTPTSLDTAECFDYESSFGGDGAYYRARTIGTPSNPIISDWSDITVVPLDSGGLCWVHDPLDTASALQLGIVTDDQRTSPLSQAITATLGSTQPVVTSDVRQVQQGTFTWVTFTTADRGALIALLNRGRTLIVRYPAEQDQAGDVIYFLPTGPITTARYAQASIPGRTVATTWIERARP